MRNFNAKFKKIDLMMMMVVMVMMVMMMFSSFSLAFPSLNRLNCFIFSGTPSLSALPYDKRVLVKY